MCLQLQENAGAEEQTVQYRLYIKSGLDSFNKRRTIAVIYRYCTRNCLHFAQEVRFSELLYTVRCCSDIDRDGEAFSWSPTDFLRSAVLIVNASSARSSMFVNPASQMTVKYVYSKTINIQKSMRPHLILTTVVRFSLIRISQILSHA